MPRSESKECSSWRSKYYNSPSTTLFIVSDRNISKYLLLFPLTSIFLNHIHPKAHKLSPQQKPAPVLEKNVTVPLHANKVAHSITSLSLQTGSLKSYMMHSINVVFAFLIALVSHVLAQNSIQFLN